MKAVTLISIKDLVIELLKDEEIRTILHMIVIPVFIFTLIFKSAIGGILYIIAYSIIVFQKKDNEAQRAIVRGSLIGYSALITFVGLLVI